MSTIYAIMIQNDVTIHTSYYHFYLTNIQIIFSAYFTEIL